MNVWHMQFTVSIINVFKAGQAVVFLAEMP